MGEYFDNESSNSLLERPIWLSENDWLINQLHWFLNATNKERKVLPKRPINEKTFPELYIHDDDCEYRWHLVKTLCGPGLVFTLAMKRVKEYQVVYDGASLTLNQNGERIIREWLGLPKVKSDREIWNDCIEEHAHFFADNGLSLKDYVRYFDGRSLIEMIAAYTSLPQMVSQGCTLREISAACFWGDSKFLENQEDIVISLCGNDCGTLVKRHLLINVRAVAVVDNILIIENQDTFFRLAESGWFVNTALVYGAGFMVSSARGMSSSVRFSFLGGALSTAFINAWSQRLVPIYFWGDLDFSGLRILASLNRSFSSVKAWQPGYNALLQLLYDGKAHLPSAVGKEKQTDPEITGCSYADAILLPALRTYGKFVDQEAVFYEVYDRDR